MWQNYPIGSSWGWKENVSVWYMWSFYIVYSWFLIGLSSYRLLIQKNRHWQIQILTFSTYSKSFNPVMFQADEHLLALQHSLRWKIYLLNQKVSFWETKWKTLALVLKVYFLPISIDSCSTFWELIIFKLVRKVH